MLRITTQEAADGFVLKLEGILAGPWVAELDTCWRSARANLGGRILRVDLRDVCSVDEPGQQLLAAMYRERVVFVARGCVMPELLREIAASR